MLDDSCHQFVDSCMGQDSSKNWMILVINLWMILVWVKFIQNWMILTIYLWMILVWVKIHPKLDNSYHQFIDDSCMGQVHPKLDDSYHQFMDGSCVGQDSSKTR